jgi:hypothetical protein
MKHAIKCVYKENPQASISLGVLYEGLLIVTFILEGFFENNLKLFFMPTWRVNSWIYGVVFIF